jgi:glutamyl/glutaminyl-tRNA synthetase
VLFRPVCYWIAKSKLWVMTMVKTTSSRALNYATSAAIGASLRGSGYRGRLAPSPTGLLHLGHARTFWTAQQRMRQNQGALILRNEDLDRDRTRPEFVTAMLEDLRWFGLEWLEGPDVGGPCSPYSQSERTPLYRFAFEKLQRDGHLYPCACSRKDVQQASSAPNLGDEEPLYPGTCRSRTAESLKAAEPPESRVRINWRFRVPNGEALRFIDGQRGPQEFIAGMDFGDFVVWRGDGIASYQLAVVVDDALMGITEVVRGADLLVSTARQLLLYQALGFPPPAFYHCPLVTDERGVRLAKRHDGLSLQSLRLQGTSPDQIRSDLDRRA